MRHIGVRSRTTYTELQVTRKGYAFEVVSAIQATSFPEAVILIPDTPEDGELARVGWMSWFLYPRVILQTVNLERLEDNPVDYLLVTPSFRPGFSPDAKLEGAALIPVSDRAHEYQETLEP